MLKKIKNYIEVVVCYYAMVSFVLASAGMLVYIGPVESKLSDGFKGFNIDILYWSGICLATMILSILMDSTLPEGFINNTRIHSAIYSMKQSVRILISVLGLFIANVQMQYIDKKIKQFNHESFLSQQIDKSQNNIELYKYIIQNENKKILEFKNRLYFQRNISIH